MTMNDSGTYISGQNDARALIPRITTTRPSSSALTAGASTSSSNNTNGKRKMDNRSPSGEDFESAYGSLVLGSSTLPCGANSHRGCCPPIGVRGPQYDKRRRTYFTPTEEESGRIRETIHRTQLVLDSLDKDDVHHRADREKLQRFINCHQAVLSPILLLPNETLVEIFLYLRSTNRSPLGSLDTRREPWSLGQVCRLWRTLVQSSSVLWSSIYVKHGIQGYDPHCSANLSEADEDDEEEGEDGYGQHSELRENYDTFSYDEYAEGDLADVFDEQMAQSSSSSSSSRSSRSHQSDSNLQQFDPFLLERQIEYSGTRPLDIILLLTGEDVVQYDPLLDVLLPHIDRWSSFATEMHGCVKDSKLARFFNTPRSYPMLKTVTCCDKSGVQTAFHVADAPMLKHALVGDIWMEPLSLPWGQLESLLFINFGVDPRDALDYLSKTPNLENLTIQLCYGDEGDVDHMGEYSHVVELPKLLSLESAGTFPAAAELQTWMLSNISAPNLRKMHHCSLTSEDVEVINKLVRSAVHLKEFIIDFVQTENIFNVLPYLSQIRRLQLGFDNQSIDEVFWWLNRTKEDLWCRSLDDIAFSEVSFTASVLYDFLDSCIRKMLDIGGIPVAVNNRCPVASRTTIYKVKLTSCSITFSDALHNSKAELDEKIAECKKLGMEVVVKPAKHRPLYF